MAAFESSGAAPQSGSIYDADVEDFFWDNILEGLTSGTLGGTIYPQDTAQLMVRVFQRSGVEPDIRTIAKALPHFPEVFGLHVFQGIMLNLGFESKVRQLSSASSFEIVPDGALIARGETCLGLVCREAGKPKLARPTGISQKFTRHRIPTNAIYITFTSTTAASISRGSDASMTVSELLLRFSPVLRQLFSITLCIFASTLVLSLSVMFVFDTLIKGSNATTILSVFAGILGLACFDFFVRLYRASLVGALTGRLEYLMNVGVFHKLINLPRHLTIQSTVSSQMSQLRQFEGLKDILTGPILLAALDVPVAVLLLLAVLLVAPPLGLILALITLGLALCAAILIPSYRRSSIKLSAKQSSFASLNLQLLAVRSHIARRNLGRNCIDQVTDPIRAMQRLRRSHQMYTSANEVISYAAMPLGSALVLGVGALMVMDGALTIGALLAATILSSRILSPIQQGFDVALKNTTLRSSIARLDAFATLPEDDVMGKVPLKSNGNQPRLALEKVVLRHPNSSTPIISGADISFEPGRVYAVTGPAASGKSTLLSVMAGIVKPQHGLITLDGQNISQVAMNLRQRDILYLPENSPYFYGTIAQNLRLAAPGCTESHLYEALTEIGLSEWVQSLTKCIDTRFDPDASARELTPNIRSGIMFAQALLTDPKILLADQSLDGLDPGLERQVCQALQNRRHRMTSFLVTQRDEIANQCDAVISVSEGQVTVLEDNRRKAGAA